MSEVFISFQSNDRQVAEAIADALGDAGFSAWCYTQQIKGGADYAEAAGRAVRDCDVMLVVITKDSLKSDQVNGELVMAKEFAKQKIPVLCGVTPEEYKAARPGWHYIFGATVCIGIQRGRLKDSMQEIVDALAELRAVREGTPVQEHRPHSTSTKPAARRWIGLAVPGAILLLIAVGVVFWPRGAPDPDRKDTDTALGDPVLSVMPTGDTTDAETQPDRVLARFSIARGALERAIGPREDEFTRVASVYTAWVPAIQNVLAAMKSADSEDIAMGVRAGLLEEAQSEVDSAQAELTKVKSYEMTEKRWLTAKREPALDVVRQWAPDSCVEATQIGSDAASLPTPDDAIDRLAESLERIEALKLLAADVRKAKQSFEEQIEARRSIYERLKLESYEQLVKDEQDAARVLNDLGAMKLAYHALARRIEDVDRERIRVAPRIALIVENDSEGIPLREAQIVQSLTRALKKAIPRVQSVRVSPGTSPLSVSSDTADGVVHILVQASTVTDDGFQDVMKNDIIQVSGELTISVVGVATAEYLATIGPIGFEKVYTSRPAIKLTELVVAALEPTLDTLFSADMLDGLQAQVR